MAQDELPLYDVNGVTFKAEDQKMRNLQTIERNALRFTKRKTVEMRVQVQRYQRCHRE